MPDQDEATADADATGPPQPFTIPSGPAEPFPNPLRHDLADQEADSQ
jgi:hypothetical protein